MGVPIYHFPGVAASRDAILQRYPSFEYAFPFGVSCAPRGALGPGGEGSLCACSSNAIGVRYEPENQVWHPVSDGVHVGWWKDGVPTPDEMLAPKTARDGVPIRLADGRQWMIPVVRFITGDTGLPAILRWDCRTGKARTENSPRYVELVNLCDRIFAAEVGRDQAAYSLEELFRLGTLALAVNYRVREAEVSALGLLDTSNLRDIADAVLDGPNLRKLMSELNSKKNESELGPDLKAGADGSPDTTQPEQKSSSIST